MVKNPPTKQETWVQSLGQKIPLEKEMATHTSILAWEIPWTEDPGRATAHGVRNSQTQLSERVTGRKARGLPMEEIGFLRTVFIAVEKASACSCLSLPLFLFLIFPTILDCLSQL